MPLLSDDLVRIVTDRIGIRADLYADPVDIIPDETGGVSVAWSGLELVEPHILSACITAIVKAASEQPVREQPVRHGWAQQAIQDQLAIRLNLSLAHITAINVELVTAHVVAVSWHCKSRISAADLEQLLS